MIEKLSDFDEFCSVFGLKCDNSKYQVSSQSNHFWAWFWLPIRQFKRSQSVTWSNNLLLYKFSPHKNGFPIGYDIKKFILLLASELEAAATAKRAIRGKKYFGWLTYSMKGLIDLSFKKIGDFEFGRLFVT